MQDQNQITPEPQAPAPAKIVDVMAQPTPVERPTAPVAAADPELMSEPAVEPAPAPAPVDAPKEATAMQSAPKETVNKKAAKKADLAPAQPKQPSTTPTGAIIVAVIMFLVLAAAALMAFRQGL